MSDLVAFLRARLDEDQQLADAAPPGPWDARPSDAADLWTVLGPYGAYSRFNADEDVRTVTAYRLEVAGSDIGAGGVRSREAAEHMARHDPARVLREVEAKRRIVEEANLYLCDSGPLCGYRSKHGHNVLRLLALPYVDHPDYREEWRP
ncbi:DUF6221 family protein [Streptomyces sp. NBC_00829]|uniref:DUF6221 family protein n=1 Tax=Streptomyces sp. NBC_00829 TaxID=2903679 RepID=UPI0038672EB0|nr:DUF6221 family protein [Streptomyces sp. NBC_00829]